MKNYFLLHSLSELMIHHFVLLQWMIHCSALIQKMIHDFVLFR